LAQAEKVVDDPALMRDTRIVIKRQEQHLLELEASPRRSNRTPTSALGARDPKVYGDTVVLRDERHAHVVSLALRRPGTVVAQRGIMKRWLW
jgi:hypothetical protein